MIITISKSSAQLWTPGLVHLVAQSFGITRRNRRNLDRAGKFICLRPKHAQSVHPFAKAGGSRMIILVLWILAIHTSALYACIRENGTSARIIEPQASSF